MEAVIRRTRLCHLHRVEKEGDRMKKGIIIAAVFALLVVGWWPATEAAAETLKGRIWAQWAENPDGEVLFGIQYWNTGRTHIGTDHRSAGGLGCWRSVGFPGRDGEEHAVFRMVPCANHHPVGRQGQELDGPDVEGEPGTGEHGSARRRCERSSDDHLLQGAQVIGS